MENKNGSNRRAGRSPGRISAVVMLVLGLGLMVFKIIADSEPGGIPILLVVSGLVWYVVARRQNTS